MPKIHVTEETHQRLKVAAARQGVTMLVLVEALSQQTERPTIGDIVQAAKESVGAVRPRVVPVDTEGI